MSKPPSQAISGLMPLIPIVDEYWDLDRFNEELDGVDDLDVIAAHPLSVYRTGTCRFDLDATGDVNGQEVAAREYLLGNPPQFMARRLSMSELTTCLDKGEHSGRMWAFALAVKAIENAPMDLEYKPGRRMARESQVNAVAEHFGATAVYSVGHMVIDASRGPNRAEGKRSGSLPGAQ